MIKDFKFDGWDFEELFECFEIPHEECKLCRDEEEDPYEYYEIECFDERGVSTLSLEEMFGLDLESEKFKKRIAEIDKNEEIDMNRLKDFINLHAGNFHNNEEVPEESKEVFNKCIEFLDALIKSSKKWSYYTPLWKGLRKIKDKGTLLAMFSELIKHMWV
jgi:hypothetical protein